MKQEEPVIFFEWYETETFESKVFLVPGVKFRDDDVPDLIQPLQLTEFKYVHSSVIEEITKMFESF